MGQRCIAILALAGVAALTGCGSSSHPATSATAASATSTGASGPSGSSGASCSKVAAPPAKGPQHLKAPRAALDPSRIYTAHMVTSCGAIDIRLDVRHAPRTSASFAALVRAGLYDSLTFHRIVPGFVIQGGDPLGNGQGGPGYTVVEPPPRGVAYTRGVVAMAKTAAEAPGSSGSQFYIVTGADAALPPDYALLGRVVSGDVVISAIEAVPNSGAPDNLPASPVVIDKVTLSVAG